MKAEILGARADGNRTILHAAVMGSFASTNKEEGDTMGISVDNENKPSQRLTGKIFIIFMLFAKKPCSDCALLRI